LHRDSLFRVVAIDMDSNFASSIYIPFANVVNDVDLTVGLINQFADDIVETITGNPGIATTKIAFVGTASGPKEIYLADYDGNNSRRLTSDRSISVAPSLGPGARNLAYTGYHEGYPDVYVIDVASGARQRVVKAPGTNSGAAISPDGGKMALTMSKDGNPEIYITGLRGGMARRLTRTRGVESSPTWSPNGSELIYSSDNGAVRKHFDCTKVPPFSRETLRSRKSLCPLFRTPY
jgi:TolB protein